MRILALAADARGATIIEYGLIAALISLACIIAFENLGLNLVTIFTEISSNLV
jgi:pilus assembly protein Flp/PilA